MVKPEIKFSFPAVLAVILCTDAKGTAGLCILACILHELGHILVMLLEGRPPERIIFCGGGIKLKGNLSKSIPSVIGGCAVNFILFVLFYFCGGDYNLKLFGVINLLTGIFNLIPIRPLDGYNLLEKVSVKIFSPKTAISFMRIAEITAAVICAPLIILFFWDSGINFSLVVFLFYLFVVDIIEKM